MLDVHHVWALQNLSSGSLIKQFMVVADSLVIKKEEEVFLYRLLPGGFLFCFVLVLLLLFLGPNQKTWVAQPAAEFAMSV